MMNLEIADTSRVIQVSNTIDTLREKLFNTFDRVVAQTVSEDEIENVVTITQQILQTIQSEGEDQVRRLEMEIAKKERLSNAVTLLGETIRDVDSIAHGAML